MSTVKEGVQKVDDTEMYTMVCKSRFDKFDEKLDTILSQLALGDGALTKRVAVLEEYRRMSAKAMGVAVTAFLTAIIGTVWGMITRSK